MAQDPRRALLNTTRLVRAPGALSGAYPFGGTELGIAGRVEVVAPSLYARLAAEETGGPGRVLALGGPCLVRFELVEWHPDALDLFFGAGSATVGANRVVTLPAQLAGTDVAPVARLLFAPVDESTDLGVIVYNAAPMLQLNAAMRASAYTYWSLPVLLEATGDAGDALCRVGRIADLATVGA